MRSWNCIAVKGFYFGLSIFLGFCRGGLNSRLAYIEAKRVEAENFAFKRAEMVIEAKQK
jgi:hypothetical protein